MGQAQSLTINDVPVVLREKFDLKKFLSNALYALSPHANPSMYFKISVVLFAFFWLMIIKPKNFTALDCLHMTLYGRPNSMNKQQDKGNVAGPKEATREMRIVAAIAFLAITLIA
eukprot:jgi/Mesvir1/5596/Mv15614-RA.1